MGYYESGLIKIDNNKIKYNSNGELTADVSEIDDTSSSTTSTYSSDKIESLINNSEDKFNSFYDQFCYIEYDEENDPNHEHPILKFIVPPATTEEVGGIKLDENDTSITIDEDGYAHAHLTMGNAPISISRLQDGQVLKYSSDDDVWKNADEYTLPIATANNLGGVKVGEGLSINPTTGVLSADTQTPPTASTTTPGIVKVDGTTVTIEDGVISSPSEIDDTASSSSKTWSAQKISQAISSASGGGDGTVTSVSAGVGLTTSDGNPITSSGTVKAKLKSETASALSSVAMGSTTDRQYAVGVDADGYLSVNVPWTDTQGGSSSVESLSDKILLSKNGILNGVSFYVNTVQYTENGANLTFTFSSGGSLTINGTKSSSDLYLLIGKYRNNTTIPSVPQLVNIDLPSLTSLYLHRYDILTGCIEDSGINVYLNYYHNFDNPQYDALDDGEIKNQNTVLMQTNNLAYNIVLKLTNTSYDNITIQPAILQDKMPIASTTYPGIVMIDGNTITMDNNIIKANFPSLTPATSSDLGGIKVGYNLNMDSTVQQGTLTADQFKISKYLAEGVEATNGKINLFEIDRYYRKAIEQDNETDYSFSNNGISITINSDYSITINGTAVQDKKIPLGYYFDIKNNDECYYTDNLEDETSLDTFVFGMRFWDELLEDYNYIRPVRNLIESSSVYASKISDTTAPEGYEISELYLSIKAGITVTDVTCYPMVLHKGYLGVTEYHPPRAFYTNRELYNKIVDFSNKMNFLMQDCVSNNVYYSLPIGYLDSNLTVDSSPYTHTITLNGTIPSGSTFDSGDIDIGYIKMNHPFRHTLLILDGGYIPEYCSLVLSNSNHGSEEISYNMLNNYDAFDLMHEYDSQEDLDKIPYTYQNANIYVISRDWETEDIGVSLRIKKNTTSLYKEYDNDFFRIDVMVYDEGFDPNGYLNYQNGYKINVNLQNEVSELTSALLNLQSRVAELENNINSNNSV